MPRQARHAPGGLAYHVINRAAGRMRLFATDADYAAFIRVLDASLKAVPIRLCAYCIMPNHWHLVLWPQEDDQLARFMHRLTITHVRQWLEFRRRVGLGSVYQGRYRSFPIEEDSHFTTVARYVERNPVRANRVKKAEQWQWSSVAPQSGLNLPLLPLAPWPVARRTDWLQWVNEPQTAAEEDAVRLAMKRNRPYGSPGWVRKTETRLGLLPFKVPGRPRGTGTRQVKR